MGDDETVTTDRRTELSRVEEALKYVRLQQYRGWSRDRILCRPADAMVLCATVRRQAGVTWADEWILWAMYPPALRPVGRALTN